MSSDHVEAADAVSQALRTYQAAVDDFDRESARALGIGETDLRCLEILLQEVPDTATPRLLADRLGITTGSTTTMLDRLEDAGLVERQPHPTDRRRVIVRATALATRRANELIGPLVEEGRSSVLAHYDTEQLQLVADFLARVTDLQHKHMLRQRAETAGTFD